MDTSAVQEYSPDTPSETDKSKSEAAGIIQKHWKNRDNDATREFMNTDLRWNDAAIHAQMKMNRIGASKNNNSPRDRWQRAGFFASRLQDGNKALSAVGVPLDETDASLKYLETQHWLELIDGKHRYGSNLKWYHRKWQESDTTDNFFRWLDQGEGKEMSLDECPRERLEEEKIQYLSAEQRMNYLVKIDAEGRLRWAKNDELVDTSAGQWKDAGEGGGIIPEDVPEGRQPARRTSFTSSLSSSSLSSEADAARHYAGADHDGNNKLSKFFHRYFTVRGSLARLLRKTIKRNTWIYCTDKKFNLFIGIKNPGNFQHSSFLAGGLVTSAGLISVKDGVIYTLSPLSGHYRTTVHHFETFIDVLKERGVNMHKAKISKAYAALWGIEHIGKWQKAQDAYVKKGKHAVKHAASEMRPSPKSKDGDASWKKEVLLGRKKRIDKVGAEEEGENEKDERKPDPNTMRSAEDILARDSKGAKMNGRVEANGGDAKGANGEVEAKPKSVYSEGAQDTVETQQAGSTPESAAASDGEAVKHEDAFTVANAGAPKENGHLSTVQEEEM